MGMGITETGNRMGCGFEAPSQEREPRPPELKKEQEVLNAAPFSCLAWPDTCPQAAVRSGLILFTGGLKERWGVGG